MDPIKVGRIKPGQEQEKLPKRWLYRDVQFTKRWADSSRFLPKDYDLCDLKLSNGKIISGWHNKTEWDGLRLKINDTVQRWKLQIIIED